MKNIRWQLIIILVTGFIIGILLISQQTGFNINRTVSSRGGTYTEALVGNLQRLNPILDYYNSADRDVDSLIFSSLISYDENGLPQPELATDWGISYDGLSYNFDIDPNAAWHDGTPVTSADIAFTIDLMRSDESVLPDDLKEFWNNVQVIPLGDQAIQFRLPEAFAPFMDYLSFGILPNHLLGDLSYQEILNSSFNLEPVGSGPYQFERLIIGNGTIKGVVLTANSSYFGGEPLISQIVFMYYADATSAYTAFTVGTVQGISEITQDILPAVLSDPDISVYSTVEPQVSMVLLNLNNSKVKFLQDENVRKALLHSIDRRRMIDSALSGQGVISNIPLIPSNWAYYDGIQEFAYDTQKAAQYFAEAGFTLDSTAENAILKNEDGTHLKIELVHPDDATHTAVAQAIQADWQKMGIEVELVAVPYDVLILDYLKPLTYQAALVDLNFERSPDPDPYPFWDKSQQSNGQNYSQWENSVVSEYLEEARVAVDQEERAKLYRNFQVMFQDELPALPLYYPIHNYAVDNGVKDIRIGSFYDTPDRFFSILDWYMVAKTVTK
ncbi:MAG: ABC transporter substrate-binding protein [Anaerolineaceae bacterium]